MPLNVSHEELSSLGKDVIEALDGVSDATAPGVAKLALASIAMLRFVETTLLDMAAEDFDSMEEVRRVQRSELQNAKAAKERTNQAIDAAVTTLTVDIAKSVCKFKDSLGSLVAKLEAREVMGEELDKALKELKAAEEQARALINDPVDPSDLGFVLSSLPEAIARLTLR
jgi:hypothetical protein